MPGTSVFSKVLSKTWPKTTWPNALGTAKQESTSTTTTRKGKEIPAAMPPPAPNLLAPQLVVASGHGVAETRLRLIVLVQHIVDVVGAACCREATQLTGELFPAPAPEIGDDDAVAAVERVIDVALDRKG